MNTREASKIANSNDEPVREIKFRKMDDLEKEGFVPAPALYFTGTAMLKTLVKADDVTNCNIRRGF